MCVYACACCVHDYVLYVLYIINKCATNVYKYFNVQRRRSQV